MQCYLNFMFKLYCFLLLQLLLPSVSRIVAFIVKKIDIIFACFIGKLDTPHVKNLKKIKIQLFCVTIGSMGQGLCKRMYACICMHSYKGHNPWHTVQPVKAARTICRYVIRGFLFGTRNSKPFSFTLITRGYSNIQTFHKFEDILVKTVFPGYPKFWYLSDYLRTQSQRIRKRP